MGTITESAAINVLVIRNEPPAVNTVSPSDGQTFTAPATINIEAAAQDADGRIVQVSFYNGADLLSNSEHKLPYTYQWQNVPTGTYTITAVAKDNWSDETTSKPVTITVMSPGTPLVSARSSTSGIKSGIKESISLHLAPNPVKNILNVCTKGFQRNKQTTLSVISASGVTIQTKQYNSYRITPTIQLNVSSLASGVYITKIMCGDKVMYRQFVKL